MDILLAWQTELSALDNASAVAAKIAELTAHLLECDRVMVAFFANDLTVVEEFTGDIAAKGRGSRVLSYDHGEIRCGGALLYLPLFLSEPRRARIPSELCRSLCAEGTLSWGAVPILLQGKPVGWVESRFLSRARRWSREDAELLLQAGEISALFLEKFKRDSKMLAPDPDESQEAVPSSSSGSEPVDSPAWVVMEISNDGTVVYVSSKVEQLAGKPAQAVRGARVFDFFEELLAESNQSEARASIERVLSGREESAAFSGELKDRNSKFSAQIFVQVEAARPQRVLVVIADMAAGGLYRRKLDEAKLRSMRLMEYGNLIIIRTDPDQRITDILGDTERIFGVAADELLFDRSIWSRFLDPGDLRLLRRMLRQTDNETKQIGAEIRVRNRRSGEVKWVFLNAIPRFDSGGRFSGWEGFGLDVSDKRESERMLLMQRRRLEALYEISRSLQVNVDPALLALRGLKSLIGATGADGGFAVFYDEDADFMEIVAAQGLSPEYLETVSRIMTDQTLLRRTIENQRGLLIENIQNDPRVKVEIWKSEGLRSVIVMPLTYEDRDRGMRVLGAIVLACRRAARFSEVDFELVQAAARQLALVVQQAEFFAAEKRQAGSLAALYRLSHELARLLSPREIGEHAFPIIQEELACKRLWFSVLNEQGTHLVGQGGAGPGMRGPLLSLQIALEQRHDFLDEALREKRAVVVESAKSVSCSGMERLLKRLGVGTFVIVPLISLGQVVGVLLAEPLAPSLFFAQRKLALLTSMCNEMATVILTRRFESKMADADKMRMAGLLASGVAHNFNNLLQAVMGQASLIEIQLSKGQTDPLLVGAARTIIESATRGARLIKQMLTLTRQGSLAFRRLSVGDLLNESIELYRSLLEPQIELEVDADQGLPEVMADSGQIQQVIANLIVNAMEAIGSKNEGAVRISAHHVSSASGEVGPEFSAGPYVRIDVADDGRGMDEHEISRCFEPFYTTKNVDLHTGIGLEGSGLGLSLSYSILKQHDGLLTVHSTKGEGSVFSLYLPAALPRVESAGDEAPLRSGARELRAAVWDSAENAQSVIEGTLEGLGIPLQVVSEEAQLMRLLREEGRQPQLLIVNFDRMPSRGAAGRALERIKAAGPQIEILGISVEPRFWQRALGTEAGVRVADRHTIISALHSVVREVYYRRSRSYLAADISVSREGSERPGRDPTEMAQEGELPGDVKKEPV